MDHPPDSYRDFADIAIARLTSSPFFFYGKVGGERIGEGWERHPFGRSRCGGPEANAEGQYRRRMTKDTADSPTLPNTVRVGHRISV